MLKPNDIIILKKDNTFGNYLSGSQFEVVRVSEHSLEIIDMNDEQYRLSPESSALFVKRELSEQESERLLSTASTILSGFIASYGINTGPMEVKKSVELARTLIKEIK